MSKFVTVEVDEVVRETDKAFLFDVDGHEEWVPKSQLEDENEVFVGMKNVQVEMTKWIADEKGFDYS